MRTEPIHFMDMKPGTGTDEYGDPKLEPVISEIVFAEIRSISQTEFYQAQTTDQKPEIKFKITDYMDYMGQKYLIHEGTRYSILRTYRTDKDELEITCYGGVRDVPAIVSDEDQ